MGRFATKQEAQTQKPLFTLPLLVGLVMLAALSAGVSYYLSLSAPKSNVTTQQGKGVPGAIPIGDPIDRRDWRPFEGTPEHKYIEKNVFPYINKNQDAIKNCYFGYRGKEKLPPKGGVITVQFFIKEDGSVEKPAVFRSDIKVEDIHLCILGKITAWRFAPHTLGKPLSYQTPFFFR